MPFLLTILNRIHKSSVMQFAKLSRKVWEILMYSGFEVGRMRKGYNSSLYLRHRKCPTVARDTHNILRTKHCFPKETMPYPDMKNSQILGIFASKWEDIFHLFMRVKKLNIFFLWTFIIFSSPNKKSHKIVSHLTIRPTHKVRYRSMH